jgi:hypothetical protein
MLLSSFLWGALGTATMTTPLPGVEPINFRLQARSEAAHEKEVKVDVLPLPTVEDQCRISLEGSLEWPGQCPSRSITGRSRGGARLIFRKAF